MLIFGGMKPVEPPNFLLMETKSWGSDIYYSIS